MDRFLIWYSKNYVLRGIAKSIGLSGLDYVLIENSKGAIKRLKCVPKLSIDKYINDINSSAELGDKLTIVVSPNKSEASFITDGPLVLTEEELSLEKDIVKGFPRYWTNDPCGVVLEKPNWEDNPLAIRYKTISFGAALARRKLDLYAGIITANIVLFCEKEECILVNRRSDSQKDYPNALHTYGGAFIPPGSDPREDRTGIKRTALREIMEEADIGVHIPKSTPKIIIDEHELQFIQTVFLGVNLTPEQLSDAASTWEGDPVIIKYSNLYERAKDLTSWTPTGWVHLLMWLASRCPGSSSLQEFGGMSPEYLADQLVIECLTKTSNGC